MQQAQYLIETIERANDAVMIVGQEGDIIYANSAARELSDSIGCRSGAGDRALIFDPVLVDSDLPRRMISTLHENGAFRERAYLKSNRDIALPVISHGAVRRSEGVWIDLSATAIDGGDQNKWRVALTMRDVSEEVRQEEAARMRTEGAEARVKISSILSEQRTLEDRMRRAVEVVLGMEQLEVQAKGGCVYTREWRRSSPHVHSCWKVHTRVSARRGRSDARLVSLWPSGSVG